MKSLLSVRCHRALSLAAGVVLTLSLSGCDTATGRNPNGRQFNVMKPSDHPYSISHGSDPTIDSPKDRAIDPASDRAASTK